MSDNRLAVLSIGLNVEAIMACISIKQEAVRIACGVGSYTRGEGDSSVCRNTSI